MIRQNVLLKDYSNYKIGGPASYFLEISTKTDLVNGLKEWEEISSNFPEDKKRIFVLGKGTNVLIDDTGFDGLVIHNNIGGLERKEDDLVVGAGVLVSDIINYCIENSLSGFEWAGGLPGTIGGAVRGNAGAFGGETKDSVKDVTSLNADTLKEKVRDRLSCSFYYRHSVFKGDAKNEIILSVTLQFKKGNGELIKNSVQEKIDYRVRRHPIEYPNIGSIFKNVKTEKVPKEQRGELMPFVKNDPFPVIPAAKLLFLSGVTGKKERGAQVSEKHPNFIVNLGNATAKDVKSLIAFAKGEVFKKFGIELEEEIMYLGGR